MSVRVPPVVHPVLKETRPWGEFIVLDAGEGFLIKRLVVKPQQRLSLQSHHQRSEHWVIVQGTAEVHHGESQQRLGPDQYIYIPVRTTHRVGNAGNTDLVLIEVQCGDYLDEDDIVRHADDYHRQ